MLSEMFIQQAISVTHLSKSFGSKRVLHDISFSANQGEVLAILGHNGAGKSTLVGCLSGEYQLDSGLISIQQIQRCLGNPLEAREAGVEVVCQDFELIGELDVTSNFFLSRELTHSNPILSAMGWLDKKQMRALTDRAMQRLGCDILNLDVPVNQLSQGEQQLIAVARAVYFGAHLLILDEPTAALGLHQMNKLQQVIKSISAQGVTILVVSHDPEFVRQTCDRAVVLRRGEKMIEVEISTVHREQLYAYMMGQEGNKKAHNTDWQCAS